jgi:hypothetical protein
MIYLYLTMVAFNISMLALTVIGGMPALNIAIWFIAAFFWSAATYQRLKSRSK